MIIDDFITNGYSTECARNLLYAGGASDVISIGIGKYGPSCYQVSMDTNFNPYRPVKYDPTKIREDLVQNTFNADATMEVENSFTKP